jgi:16S rRNA (guanine966-N2)-methyltransferase
MRVISGSAGGRRLKSVSARWLRPTTDRVRTVLFDCLGERVRGAVVLDLFCGTGALGIEALSRGAARAVFVDIRPQALKLVAENLRLTSLSDRAELVRSDVRAFLRKVRPPAVNFDIVFADPPYTGVPGWAGLLARVASVLRRGGVFVLEESVRSPLPPLPPTLALSEIRRVGETRLIFAQRKEAIVASAAEGDLSGDL